MNANILSLFPATITIVYVVYGSYLLFTDITFGIVPHTVILTTFIVLAIEFFRIPAPDAKAVVEVLGTAPYLSNKDSEYVIRVIGHRGAGWDAPENSLRAFKMCSDKGCDFVEFDVMLTGDGVPIVFHDSTLERMTGVDLAVHESTWDYLSKIDISIKHPLHDLFPDTRIPTLDQAVSQLLNCGQRMIVDIKEHSIKIVPVILNLFKRYPELKSKCVVSTFYPYIIYLIRRGNPKIVCSLAWNGDEFAYDKDGCFGKRRSEIWYKHCLLQICDILHEWALPRLTYYLLGLSVILLHKESISGEVIMNWHNKGVRVMTWTVNCPIEKLFVERDLRITYLTDTLVDQSSSVYVG